MINYAKKFSEPISTILNSLERETYLKTLMPRMLSGSYQGKLLEFISLMIKPLNILEIGTFTGYSAICLSKGLKEGGLIHTIEINEENEDIILKYFKLAGISDKAKLYIGDAVNIIPQLNIQFDLVFIDADKENYLNYYNLVIDKINIGAFILADNVFWDAKVLNEYQYSDNDTKAIIEFNNFVHNDRRVQNLFLPVRDGLMVLRKC
ncbi:MAG: O-methyltransferase [Bacteroidales bacterium]|nr:O-methyltransferase [Bacteroidales bacterium]